LIESLVVVFHIMLTDTSPHTRHYTWAFFVLVSVWKALVLVLV